MGVVNVLREAGTRWWRGSTPVDGDGFDDDRIEWARLVPFVALHLTPFAVLGVGVSPAAVALAIASYAIRMFAITG
ncbi:MAG: hypothetical protein KDC38_12715, partial [Planctomycetes bacterium]|nr:hypothetical protein [Planctomycetota bacterium]